MYLVNDIYLVSSDAWGIGDAIAQQAHLINAVVAGSVDFQYIHTVFIFQLYASIAYAAWLAILRIPAVDGPSQYLCGGGFSGSAIFPVAVRMVYQVANAVKIPVVGMGGVSSAENVIEMMLAGATAVEVGAANLVDPFVCRDIIEQLPAVMDKYRINTLSEIIGGTR